ncbi:MAG: hypothetical protein ACLSHO_13325 [Dysosmobacter sp.]
MEATRIRLAEGVHLTYLPARKFKTSLLSAQFVTPLRRETAGANALLAAVLRRGTVSCPDMGALSRKDGQPLRCLHRLHSAKKGRKPVRGLCGQLY